MARSSAQLLRIIVPATWENASVRLYEMRQREVRQCESGWSMRDGDSSPADDVVRRHRMPRLGTLAHGTLGLAAFCILLTCTALDANGVEPLASTSDNYRPVSVFHASPTAVADESFVPLEQVPLDKVARMAESQLDDVSTAATPLPLTDLALLDTTAYSSDGHEMRTNGMPAESTKGHTLTTHDSPTDTIPATDGSPAASSSFWMRIENRIGIVVLAIAVAALGAAVLAWRRRSTEIPSMDEDDDAYDEILSAEPAEWSYFFASVWFRVADAVRHRLRSVLPVTPPESELDDADEAATFQGPPTMSQKLVDFVARQPIIQPVMGFLFADSNRSVDFPFMNVEMVARRRAATRRRRRRRRRRG